MRPGTYALCALLMVNAAPLSAQQTGRVAGSAVEAETGRALAGASVMVDGTSISVTTDPRGRFVLPRVPAGQLTLVLTYIGREPQRRDITVRAAETTAVDFSVPVAAIALEGLTVLGIRANTQAEALSRQKNATNIKNIVASDQIGRFPDPSAPDAVQRLPGVSIARDQGEGRYIQVRGGSAANTQVSFNGVQVPSPEGDDRQIALDAVPVDVLESIEVSKAILPDMDADAIGGAVNLVTRKAPERRYLTVEATGGFAPLREELAGSGAATFGTRTADGRFGFLASGTYSKRNFGSDDVEPAWDLGDPGAGDDILEELELRNYSLWRSRTGATANLDYRFSPTSSIHLTGVYSALVDEEQRRRMVNIIEDGELEFLHKNRKEELTTFNVTFGGEHLLGSAKIDYLAAWAKSGEDTPYDSEITFLQEGVTFAPSISDPDEIRANPQSGAVAGEFLFDEIEPASSNTEDTDWIGALNLTLPFGLAERTGNLKFGFKIRDKDKTRDVVENAYELTDGDLVLGTDVGGRYDQNLKFPADYDLPPSSTSPDDVRNFPDRFGSMLEGEPNIEADAEDYDVTERVLAGYAMAEIHLTPRLLLLPGVRYERTKVESIGYAWDSEEETLTPTEGDKDYGNVFPMVHLRWELGQNTNLRGAFTSAIARPNFIQLVPYRIRDDEDVELGNPDLEPTLSRNFDVLFEHYDQRIGVLSAGVFYKRLTDPIFVFTDDNELGGETEQPDNGESAWIAGVEVALQRQLGAGFGVWANYTFTDSEAELPSGRKARLQGQSDHVFNAAANFERAGFFGQVSGNYHHDYVDEYAGEDYEDVYVDNHFQLDASASYRFGGATIFLELNNLTNEPFQAFQGTTDRPIQQEYYGRWGRIGLRWAM